MSAITQSRLVVIDVMPLLYRGHFAFITNPRMTSRGENVSALQGVAMGLAQVLKDPETTHLALAFDSRTETFRKEIDPQYKATAWPLSAELFAVATKAVSQERSERQPSIRRLMEEWGAAK